nr:1-(5-phosphoribosyl)-5-((5-phosphoribosylamino)methylideneamino)imidazole-4-carboxamide isomerase [Ktedonobacterales bacterium]
LYEGALDLAEALRLLREAAPAPALASLPGSAAGPERLPASDMDEGPEGGPATARPPDA